MLIRQKLRFYLNDRYVELVDVPHQRTLLDFLRLDCALKGTKEGCAEGDCGACTVLVGRLDAEAGLVYETINACIRLLPSLDGTHVVTIEHLAGPDDALHPVQQAMVDCHASQCGFCTPGIVMSLYGQWLRRGETEVNDIEVALQGNLCRCTGYSPIIAAAQSAPTYGAPADDPLMTGRADMTAKLLALKDGARLELESEGGKSILPPDADDLAEVLATHPAATLVAGATDVGLWVTKFMRPLPVMVYLNSIRDLRDIVIHDDRLELGALVSYSSAAEAIGTHIPQLAPLWRRIGGLQVRNAGTVGGNIANGSPIGDTPPALIALGASITLRRDNMRRTVRLEDYFIAYGKQDRQPSEFLECIAIPLPRPDDRLAVYKVSKRHDEDISSVLGAFRLRLTEGHVSEITIAYGGMAGTPIRARAIEASLIGKPWTRDTVAATMALYDETFTPLSDWRASAQYRLLVAKNLLLRFWTETHEETRLHVRELIDG